MFITLLNKARCVFFYFFILSFVYLPDVYSSEFHTSRVDSHAPIGVMGDHMHSEGEVMVSYRYMYMDMQGNRVREDNVSDDRVLDDFMIAPTDMQMQMHMIGVMYAVNDDLTLMGMIPISRKDMNHANRAGIRFRTNSEGLGDIALSGLVSIHEIENKKTHANLGLSFPTGSINQIDDLPTGKGKRLPYPMQLGSGTIDLRPGITHNEQWSWGSWGVQASGIIRLGRNRIGYSLGDEVSIQTWLATNISEDLSVSTKLDYSLWSNINGQDNSLNPNMVPTADTKSRGGKRIDLVLGVNYYPREGMTKDHRIAFEAGFPVFENVDGPQLSMDWKMTIGWQKAF